MKIDTPKRSFTKAVSWRVFSIFITFCVTIFITGSTRFAIEVSSLDAVIKMIIYYFHERFWTHLKWGRKKKKKNKKKQNR